MIPQRQEPLLLSLSLLVLAAVALSCSEVKQRRLEPAEPVESALAAGEIHSYWMKLPAGSYVRIVAGSQSIDFTLQAFDLDNRPLAEAAALPNDDLDQMLSLITGTAGDYRLEMRAISEESAAGTYVVEIVHLRPATESDRHRVVAERRYSEGIRLRLEETTTALRRAIAKYELALASWQRAGDPTGQAAALNAIGYAYRLLGEYARALDYYAEALPFWRQADKAADEVDTLNNMGFAARRLGDPELAIEYYGRAIERAGGDLDRSARGHNNLALVYRSMTRLDEALDHYHRALELRRAGDDEIGAARVQSNLAGAYRELQEHRQALDLYHEAVPVLRLAGDPRSLATALNNLATTYGVLGQYERASVYLAEALELTREAGDRRGEGRTLSNLGWSLHFSGQPREALEYFGQALELPRAVRDDRARSATLLNAARSYRQLGQIERALEHYRRGLELKRSVRDPRGEAVALIEIASMDIDEGRIEEALQGLKSGLHLSRSTRLRAYEAVALLEWSRAERSRGDLVAALERIEEAIEIVESRRGRVGSHSQRAAFLATKHRFYEQWIDILMELERREASAGYRERALRASEQAHARTLIDMLEEGQIKVDQRVGRELREREMALQRRANQLELLRSRLARRESDAAQVGEVEQALVTALAELEQVRTRIRGSDPAYAALTEPASLDLDEIRRQILDPETVLLEFALGHERSFLWVASETSIDSFELPGREVIDETARRVYELLTARERTPAGETLDDRHARIQQADLDFPAAARELSNLVLGPAAGTLTAPRWLIVAGGSLSYVPFSALPGPRAAPANGQARPGGEAWRPLILDREIVRLPSASSLAVIRRDAERRRPAERSVVVLADPVFSAEDSRLADLRSTQPSTAENMASSFEMASGVPLQRLKFTREEAEAIAESVPDADLLLGPEASRAAVVDGELEKYRVVHFATHGELNNRHPQLSALVLTLFDEEGQVVDGYLRLHDIYNLELRADLVVLSACQTALGKEIRGEGLVGLTRGFMYAGARSVLATLWTVQDRATRELMGRFYERMLRDGERPAAAIREAQLALLASRRFETPYYWAGFELQGEWR